LAGWIADLRRHAFPHRLDGDSALHHAGTRWKRGRIIGVERRDASEITLVEEIDPFRIHGVNFSLLGERRDSQPGHQGNRQCNPTSIRPKRDDFLWQ
jgi:hypothetical protein